MTAQTATEALVTPKGSKAGRRPSARDRGKVQHKGAILFFTAPFVILFLLFYLVPIAYAIWQSLLVVEREGTFGEATEVFGGLTQYMLVFQNEAFWTSVGRVLLFGVVQVPGHAGARAAVRAAAGFTAAARQEVLPPRLLRPVRRARASSRRSCGASSTRRTSRRSRCSPATSTSSRPSSCCGRSRTS